MLWFIKRESGRGEEMRDAKHRENLDGQARFVDGRITEVCIDYMMSWIHRSLHFTRNEIILSA